MIHRLFFSKVAILKGLFTSKIPHEIVFCLIVSMHVLTYNSSPINRVVYQLSGIPNTLSMLSLRYFVYVLIYNLCEVF